jgi:hypothetical protein
MLSAVQFLHHLFTFCQDIFVGPYPFVTNNQGLITRVQDRQTYAESYPNSTLDPDWDVVNEIVQSLSRLSNGKTIHHVKGHQDNTIAYETSSSKLGQMWTQMQKQATTDTIIQNHAHGAQNYPPMQSRHTSEASRSAPITGSKTKRPLVQEISENIFGQKTTGQKNK